MSISRRALVLVLVAGLPLTLALPGAAEAPGKTKYKIHITHKWQGTRQVDGRNELWVERKFRLERLGDAGEAEGDEEIVITEDGREVKRLKVASLRAEDLTVVLCMDVSGSMAKVDKPTDSSAAPVKRIDAARKAAEDFLKSLSPRTDVGLILFDHRVPRKGEALAATRLREPARDKSRLAEHRQDVLEVVRNAKEDGGTAYLDATAEAVRMLQGIKGRRAVVVMTDGIDTHSDLTLQKVVAQAKESKVSVFTIGIGDKGKGEPVSTVLVLDRSGSMNDPADKNDKTPGIVALKKAASMFVKPIRPSSDPNKQPPAQTTLLPFSDTIDAPEPFSTDKEALKERIARLEARGGTHLYDAAYAGVETLVAANLKGRKAVVLMTDGRDESQGSRRSYEEVRQRADQAGVKIYALGFGADVEANVLTYLATNTSEELKGSYRHAGNAAELVNVFEQLSIELHDDGVDEASLTELATATGGTYTHVRDSAKLRFTFEDVRKQLETTYEVEFKSLSQKDDGTARSVDIDVWRDGMRISEGGRSQYVQRGVLVPEMSATVYLCFLGALVFLALLPAGLRRLGRGTAEG